MKAKRSARLVIDTDIARAAGTSEAPRSSRSREFLESVLLICQRVVITPAISEEWGEHRSRFFTGWLRSMTAKKKVERLNPQEDRRLRQALGTVGFGPRQIQEAEKDAHLLEAALAADRVVCSLDASACEQFRRVARVHERIGEITWADPGGEPDEVRTWLESGARAVRKWQLGG